MNLDSHIQTYKHAKAREAGKAGRSACHHSKISSLRPRPRQGEHPPLPPQTHQQHHQYAHHRIVLGHLGGCFALALRLSVCSRT